MKFIVATLLVISSLVSAVPPRFRSFARQTAEVPATTPAPAENAPYPPSGWRPAGAPFNLPQKSQLQELYGPPSPSPSYGPPELEPDATTDATTEQYNQQAENIQRISNKKPAKIQAERTPVFLILPQREKLVYAVQQSAPFAAVPEGKILTSAPLQSLPLPGTVLTSIGGPYVQIYQ